MKRTLLSSMVTNPRKFHVIFVGSSIDNSNITFLGENKRMKSSNEVELL